ncbi:class I SAM-dependent methyltransferase [Thiomicrorhabdus sediminis]|uniref:Class I SAM-dependent methyltransferase n=1 Tax=Thiomicrorhabdus sediminis TaxID=2580412 RepID=A0A4P9K3F8_9GAMM|nr:class I SAM-dependent methyltransferase [Thiomicrorhabdus sediminis]QCU89389.1 class I SAM-dependent methyltransferase [Thiomicrorhabdus sediminis]
MPNWFLMLTMTILKLVMSKKGLAKQARQPSGWYGKYIAQPMFINGNAALNQLIFSSLDLKHTDHVLEIGFGPGVLLQQIAVKVDRPYQVFGLDFSTTMVEQASQRNRQLLTDHKLQLQLGNSVQMPYGDARFDKVCCANTLYFWQPLAPHLLEILRCLKPQGQLVIGFRDAEQINAMQLDEELFARYSREQVKHLLLDAGFSDVRIIAESALPLDSYVAIATK